MHWFRGLDGPKGKDKSGEDITPLPSPGPQAEESIALTGQKLARLPTELYRLILSFIPPGTKITPLLFVNSAFHEEAVRILYSRISFTGQWMGYIDGRRSTQPDARVELFVQLASMPRLSHIVQSLELYPFVNQGGGWNHLSLRERYWTNLNLALREMPNLKEFSIGTFAVAARDMEGLPAQKICAVFAGCTFRLRKLVLLQESWEDLSILETEQTGGGVKELGITWELWEMLDVKRAFPLLTTFEVAPHRIHHLQFMSPPLGIKAFAFTSPWDHDRGQLAAQIAPCSDLRSLKVEGWNKPKWSLVGIIFPSLRFLRVHFTRGSGDSQMDQAIDHLAALVHLRKVSFSDEEWNSSFRSQKIAEKLFSHHSQLEFVSFGADEWSRALLGTGKPTVCDWPDEWKSRVWWD